MTDIKMKRILDFLGFQRAPNKEIFLGPMFWATAFGFLQDIIEIHLGGHS